MIPSRNAYYFVQTVCEESYEARCIHISTLLVLTILLFFASDSVEENEKVRVHVPFISKDVITFDMRDHGQCH